MFKLIGVDVSPTRHSQAPVIAAAPRANPDNTYVEYCARFPDKKSKKKHKKKRGNRSPLVATTLTSSIVTTSVGSPLPPPPKPPLILLDDHMSTPQSPASMNWERLLSSKGKHYYYNNLTGESTYKIPSGWVSPSPTAKSVSTGSPTPSPDSSTISYGSPLQLTPQTSRVPPPPPPPPIITTHSYGPPPPPPLPPSLSFPSTPTGAVQQQQQHKRRSLQPELERCVPQKENVVVAGGSADEEEEEGEGGGESPSTKKAKVEEGEDKKEEEKEDTRALIETAKRYNLPLEKLEKFLAVERPKLHPLLESGGSKDIKPYSGRNTYEGEFNSKQTYARYRQYEADFMLEQAQKYKARAEQIAAFRESLQPIPIEVLAGCKTLSSGSGTEGTSNEKTEDDAAPVDSDKV